MVLRMPIITLSSADPPFCNSKDKKGERGKEEGGERVGRAVRGKSNETESQALETTKAP